MPQIVTGSFFALLSDQTSIKERSSLAENSLSSLKYSLTHKFRTHLNSQVASTQNSLSRESLRIGKLRKSEYLKFFQLANSVGTQKDVQNFRL